MIKPLSITDYNRTLPELEEFLIFSVFVAGKRAKQMVKKLDDFKLRILKLEGAPSEYLDDIVLDLDMIATIAEQDHLDFVLRECKIGQYDRIGRALEGVMTRFMGTDDLITLKPEELIAELEAIHGIGPKTSRFFVLHSRRDVEVAVLDTHILKWLRSEIGLKDAPLSTPTNSSSYAKWERNFLHFASLCREPHESMADFDLRIWTKYSQGKDKSL